MTNAFTSAGDRVVDDPHALGMRVELDPRSALARIASFANHGVFNPFHAQGVLAVGARETTAVADDVRTNHRPDRLSQAPVPEVETRRGSSDW